MYGTAGLSGRLAGLVSQALQEPLRHHISVGRHIVNSRPQRRDQVVGHPQYAEERVACQHAAISPLGKPGFPIWVEPETVPALNRSLILTSRPPPCLARGNFSPFFRPSGAGNRRWVQDESSSIGEMLVLRRLSPWPPPLVARKAHAPCPAIGGGGSASRSMRSRIAANKFRVTATSAS
jgi:hypothetical protein